ncbi:MAG: alanine racemase [Sphingobacteriia bacterium]|nr:alanine racemase [Sphingobacteriia bacterium]
MYQSIPKLIVNLNAVLNNFKYLGNLINPSELCAVVKANSYGIGMNEVSKTLYEFGKCRKFFVANIEEGIQLRKILPEAIIYVFHGMFSNEEEDFLKNNLIPILNDFYQLEIWQNFAKSKNLQLKACLHFDTGMNRLGFNSIDVEKVKAKLDDSLKIDYVLSHLAWGENKNSDLNKFQLEKFNTISKYFPEAKKSLTNSPGIFLGKEYYFDMIRIGRGLYGQNQYASLPTQLENVVSIYAPIIQVRNIYEDSPVGYSATHIMKKGSKLAVLAIGYAEGYMRLFGNMGWVNFEGFKLPVVGKISMDLITVDVTEVPDEYLQIGKFVEIIGKNIDFHNVLVQAGTSSSELFSRLGQRLIREYIEVR